MMTTHRKEHKMKNELLTVTEIMKTFKVGRKKATKIYAAAKSLDEDKWQLRPTQVPVKLVRKVYLNEK